MNTIIKTINGSIEIQEPDSEMIDKMEKLLSLVKLECPLNGVKYGIVMQYGKKEAYCVKLQPVEVDRKSAEWLFHSQHLAIVIAYYEYMKAGFSGAYLAAPYLRQRDNGLWEAGVSNFMYPMKDEKVISERHVAPTYDRLFGVGATDMFIQFVQSLKDALKIVGINKSLYFGMDLRYRSHLQSLGMYFMVLDSRIVCLRENLREDDAAWNMFSINGVNKVYHCPAVPLAIPVKK